MTLKAETVKNKGTKEISGILNATSNAFKPFIILPDNVGALTNVNGFLHPSLCGRLFLMRLLVVKWHFLFQNGKKKTKG